MPKKLAEYRLSPAADRDLQGIWLYTFGEWGIQQARRYTNALTAVMAELANNPDHGVSCDAIRKGYYRNRVGRHFIYFRRTAYGIAVIRVLHDRMDALRQL
jgi:toxin ParE1/3/4